MAMRDNSSHLLSQIITRLEEEGSDTSAFTTVIEHKFIPALRDGLRAKNEVKIHEPFPFYNVDAHTHTHTHTHLLYTCTLRALLFLWWFYFHESDLVKISTSIYVYL